VTNFEKIHRWPPSCSPRTDGNYFSTKFRFSVPWPFVYSGEITEQNGAVPDFLQNGAYLEADTVDEGNIDYDLVLPTHRFNKTVDLRQGIIPTLGPGYVIEPHSYNFMGEHFETPQADWGVFWNGLSGTQYSTDVTGRLGFIDAADDPPLWFITYLFRPEQFDWTRPF